MLSALPSTRVAATRSAAACRSRAQLPARCKHAVRRAQRSSQAEIAELECSTSSRGCETVATIPLAALLAVAACGNLLAPGAAEALTIHAEPANALSLPTWAIHVSSVVEWVTAMGLMWKYAEATNNPRWKGMAWGMVPSLGSAMAACTWHFFYNSPDLEFLVVVQSALTVIGNCTCWWAAYRIYEAAQAEKSSA
ncbi:hypothetical protein CHLRE_12g555400v5 [Chlamydomonas reinhardtii]|uniref:Ycf49-like protein n=1 Tax=Chlamydomonas reinhardtii TaxID=3055 RepID=A8IYQ9_CHLRE|nr:uncharacterized protein CHLRE_12g555400v5 [Chlamydomonas reinhardtii]PNW75908.1 hypothetical protein CHLRE_12g555400v5 [Chlamydomonas reinhardtii]|eukprot:XP_001694043.1 predicted protein [Chlamydomonas reinhardtii]